ncbi:hypothetical protein [Catenovulum sediminis]|uniref:Uncharacterized protein n=1 Tax=Catenovulum sediminis TaxID=1740262 RepID=A0ABV1RLE9_9ALTE
MQKLSKDQLWHEYVTSHDFNDLKSEVLAAGYQIQELEDALKLDYKDAQLKLKSILPMYSFKRLNGRFRAYVHRLQTQKTTITVDSFILTRLDALKAKMELDSYADLLEYLIKPDGQYAKEIKDFLNSNRDYASGSLQASIQALLSVLYYEHQVLIKKLMTEQFERGWHACKSAKTKSTKTLLAKQQESIDEWFK